MKIGRSIRALPVVPRGRRAWWRWWKRFLRIVVLAGVGVWSAYVVGMNLFLRTRLFRNLINFDPIMFRVEYASAYSLLPGRIHVDGLTLRGKDSHIEWTLALDHCDFAMVFRALLRHQFHATRVRGDGVSFRVRFRIAVADPEHLAAIPPIDGFPDPPWKDIGPPRAPLTDANYNLWGVALDDVDARNVREIWTDTIRYAGDMRIRGRWVFWPVRWLDIGPAVVDLHAVEVGYGRKPLVTGIDGAATARIHPFDVRVPEGSEILREVSLDARVHGRLKTAAALETFVQVDDVNYLKGEGPMELRVLLDHGVIEPSTHLTAASEDTQVKIKGYEVESSVHADLDVYAAEGGNQAVAHGLATEIRIAKETKQADIASADVVLRSHDLDLAAGPFQETTFGIDLRGAATASLGPWRSLIVPRADIGLESGPAKADAHFEGSVADERATGHVEFAVEGLSLSHGSERLFCGVAGRVEVPALSLREQRFDLSETHLQLQHAVARIQGVELRAQTLAVEVERALLQPRANDVALAVDFPHLELPRLLQLSPLFPRGSAVSITGGRAWARGHAEIRLPQETITGHASLGIDQLTATAKDVAFAGSLTAKVALRKYAWERDEIGLSSDIAFSDVTADLARSGNATELVRIPSLSVRTPSLTVAHGRPTGTLSVDIPRAEIPALAAVGSLVGLPNDLKIEGGNGVARMRVNLDLASLTATGDADLWGHEARLRFGSERVSGDLVADLRADGRDGVTNLTGSSVQFVSRAAPKARAWWGRGELRDATLRLLGGLRFRSELHLAAEDASPIAAVLAAGTPVPKWVLDAVPMKGLVADGELRLTPSSLEIRSLAAHGGSDTVRLEYTKLDSTKAWALYVEAGLLRAGFQAGEPGTPFVLFKVKPWFDEKVNELKMREAAASGNW
jgi:hypothetical protein